MTVNHHRNLTIFMGTFVLMLMHTPWAQTFESAEGKIRSPLSMIKLMEEKLGNQFALEAGEVANQTSAQVIQDSKTAGKGAIISGQDSRFSYLIFPADCLKHQWFTVKDSSGKLLKPVEGTPVQVLSKNDNLAIVRLTPVANSLSIEKAIARTPVGLFIGYPRSGNKWSTGAVTNERRTAYTGVAPATQKALVKHWQRIGLKVSDKRSGFPEVVETDLDLKPDEAGSPIFDRNGNWQGIAISRADQHSTFVIPASRVISLVNRFEAAHR